MSHILVLGGGTQGLALVEALHKCGHRVIMVSAERGNYADSSRYVDKMLYYSGTTDKYLSFIKQVITDNCIDSIIPTGDDNTEFLCLNRSAFPNRVKFNLPSYTNFERGYDKNQLMTLCKEKGYPHPHTIDLSITNINSDEVRDFDYPGMLKPNCTTGGRGMIEINSYDELIDKYPSLPGQYGENHLQKFIKAGGRQEKIQLYVDANQKLIVHSVLHKLRWYPNRGGSNTCCVTIEDEKMVTICHQILKDIEWVGFADFDLIQNPDTGEMLIMEINPRIPACIKGAMVAGINWPEIIVNDYLGLPQKQYNYKTGVYLRHIGLDILWFIHAQNRWSAKPNWFHFFGRNIHYQDASSFSDPLPFIKGTFRNICKLFDPKFKQAKQI